MTVPPDWYSPYEGPELYPSPLTPPHFLAFLPPPTNKPPPNPARPPLAPPPPGWTRSYHAIPAASPRQLRESAGPYGRGSHPYRLSEPPPNESKASRKARIAEEGCECARIRHSATEWSLEEGRQAKDGGQKGLFLCVERWRREVPRGGRTIVCTHACGMQKEHWHPVFHNILNRAGTEETAMFGTVRSLSQHAMVEVDDIWMLDDVHHGASLDLNGGLLGPTQNWDDTGRDALNFILHVLPSAQAQDPNTLAWQLPWAPEGAAPAVKVIGFGGSLGGCAHVMAAHTRPDAYEGLFLCDPMVPPRLVTPEVFKAEGMGGAYRRGAAALKRRDTWSSRAVARESMLSTPFYQTFHPAVFDVTVSHGLVPVDPVKPAGEVTLATAPWCETAVFVEPISPARAWDMLPNLRVPIGFLMARDPERTLGEETTHELVWRPPLARNERAIDADHLILQQNPVMTAESAWRFLATLSAGEWGRSPEEIRATYKPEIVRAKL